MSKSPASRKDSAPVALSRHKVRALALIACIGVLLIVMVTRDIWPFGPWDGGRNVAAQRINDASAPLADFYTPEVLYWRDEIRAWAAMYQINPNVIAVLMQIESCGSPEVLSWAGAVGLMQVMPYHFDDGDNMLNPDTNVRHGMRIFQECLNVFAGGHIGIAAACYNGGASVTRTGYAYWPSETQAYYDWATSLWADVVSGVERSTTLQRWLDSGGARLCAIAANDLFPPAAAAP